MKACTKCGKGPARSAGNTWCKPCNAAQMREWRKANPEKWAAQRARSNARTRERYATDAEYRVHVNARNSAAQDPQRESATRRRRLYGLPLSATRNMLRQQNSRCAICTSDLTQGRGTNVDHDHVTGFVRGLLCSKCNVGLGCFADNVERLTAAAQYLNDFQPPAVVSLASLDAC